jgi:hypothetical protein
MKPNRIQSTRPADLVKTKLTDSTIGHDDAGLKRTFFYGQVISSDDSQNANRIKVRIPLLDNPFYTDENGKLDDTLGHDKLPYCISAHGRAIDTPENGSVVLVALMDPLNPFLGRIWFTAIPELTSKDIFDSSRLNEETDQGWDGAEKAINVKYNNSPGVDSRPKLKNKPRKTNYKVGVRGKDKNKLLFDKGKTTLIQNEAERNKETLVELTENMRLLSQQFEMLSSKNKKRYHPMFGDPNYKWQESLLSLINQIITLLNTQPAFVFGPAGSPAGIPAFAAPGAIPLQATYAKLKVDFEKLKLLGEGQSKEITIN